MPNLLFVCLTKHFLYSYKNVMNESRNFKKIFCTIFKTTIKLIGD